MATTTTTLSTTSSSTSSTTSTLPPETFETDFSEYGTGSPPGDWTERWGAAEFALDIEANAWEFTLGSKRLLFDASDVNTHFASWDDVDGYADVDVIALINMPVASGDNVFRLYVRGSGGDGSENGYYVEIDGSTNYIRLYKYVSGVASTIATSVEYNFGNGSWYWVRLRAYGTTIQAKVWDYFNVEPEDWYLSGTDSDVSGGGWVGVGNEANADFYVDYFKVVTNGGEASIPSGFQGDTRFGPGALRISLSTTVNFARALGGEVHASADGRQVRGCRIYIHSPHNNQVRLALYRGGDLSTGPAGATLLKDFGLTTGSGTSEWQNITCDPITINDGDILWLVVKGDDSGFGVIYDGTDGVCGDWQIANGRWASASLDTDETVAFPSTWPADAGSFGTSWYQWGLLLDGSPLATTSTTASTTSSTASTTSSSSSTISTSSSSSTMSTTSSSSSTMSTTSSLPPTTTSSSTTASSSSSSSSSTSTSMSTTSSISTTSTTVTAGPAEAPVISVVVMGL